MPNQPKKKSSDAFKTFGELLRYARKRTHLTQSELGVLIGYHHSYISYLEKNLRLPDKAVFLGRIVPALGLQNENELIDEMLKLLELESKKQSFLPKSQPASYQQKSTRYVLPAKLTSIIGREHETQILLDMLHSPIIRIITITGAPGVGKTRLALHVANYVQDSFNDGVVFADLIPVTHSDFVMNSIASVLSQHKVTAQDLQSALENKNVLIVIDNFEHVLDAAPQLIPILENLPNIKILVTSRESLHIQGEQEFPLFPLALSSKFNNKSPAFQLFLERTQTIQPDFQVDEKNASDIAQICERLDGLPLAIEIAAAQTRTMNPATILQKLDTRLNWIRRENHLPTQQKTLQGAIEWSYTLLSKTEKLLFARLAIFSGGWTLDAAEEVCNDEIICKKSEIFNTLNSLVSKSLLVSDTTQNRYTFLETLREFAKQELKKTDEIEYLNQKHCKYYLSFSEKILTQLNQKEFDDIAWMIQMQREHNNFRVALTWSTTLPGDSHLSPALIRSISQYLMLSGNLSESSIWFDKILAIQHLDKRDRIRLLHIAGDGAGKQGDNEKGRKYQMEGLELAKEIQDSDLIYLSIEGMARAEYREGNYLLAIDLFEEALSHKRKGTNKIAIIRTLNYLAISNREAGNLDRALEVGLESIEICRSINALPDLEHALIGVGEVYVRKKEFKKALQYQCESLLIAQQLGFLHGISTGLSFMAHSLHHFDQSILAIHMQAVSDKIRTEIGIAISTPASVEKKKKFHAELRNKLGDDVFEREWENGRKISTNDIVDMAIDSGNKNLHT